MRLWDINPGYLNRQSLLGEHRELHGIVSILVTVNGVMLAIPRPCAGLAMAGPCSSGTRC